jgi:hypothetical protein
MPGPPAMVTVPLRQCEWTTLDLCTDSEVGTRRRPRPDQTSLTAAASGPM